MFYNLDVITEIDPEILWCLLCDMVVNRHLVQFRHFGCHFTCAWLLCDLSHQNLGRYVLATQRSESTLNNVLTSMMY